ncbi:MAG: hypothetical protein CSA23_05900 [Deltaproteobacteria bacterium]|nr:MAG: hypothetical protein CSA23_05900 [Deltaproteobacteria bacterium]
MDNSGCNDNFLFCTLRLLQHWGKRLNSKGSLIREGISRSLSKGNRHPFSIMVARFNRLDKFDIQDYITPSCLPEAYG